MLFTRVNVPEPVLVRMAPPVMTPLKSMAVVLVLVGTFRMSFVPLSVTVAPNSSGLLPPSVTLALLSDTALFHKMPLLPLAANVPLTRVSVPVPRASTVPRFSVAPVRAVGVVAGVKVLAVGRLTVPEPVNVRPVAAQ